MANTGFKSPSSTGEIYNSWDNPTYAYASDGNRAEADYGVGSPGSEQDYYDFSFNIPSGATIDGIEVVVEGYAEQRFGTTTADGDVRLSWDGGATWTTVKTVSGGWENSGSDADVEETFGGSGDTWGRTWSDSELADGNFRVHIEFTDGNANRDDVHINHVKVDVYYTDNTESAERAAKLSGVDTSQSERSAVTSGGLQSSAERASELSGEDDVTATRDAKIHGSLDTNSERSAELFGGLEASAERGAKLDGSQQEADSERPAELHGQDTDNAERAAKLHGNQTADSERSAHTTGQQSATSERAAKLTGVTAPALTAVQDGTDIKLTWTYNS